MSIALFALFALPGSASATGPDTWIASGPSGTISTDSVTFAFASYEQGGFECRLDSSDPDDWKRCSSPQSYSSLAEGPHRFEVRALDRHCHPDPVPAVATFTVDTTPPEATIAQAPSGTIDIDSAIFSFDSSEAGGFECRLDSAEESAWAPCASPQPYFGLADGPHEFEVRSRDAAGNVDPTPATVSFATDTTAPETTIVSGPSGAIDTDSASFAFTASEPGDFQCRLDTADPGAWSPCAPPQSYHSLAGGPHEFEVRATDEAGNVDPTPAVARFDISLAGFDLQAGPLQPVAGQSLDVAPVKGTVKLRCPGESAYAPLTTLKQIPTGCLVDTRNGVVDLTASKGDSGEVQGAHFWGGIFLVSQNAGNNQDVQLKLAGRRVCERRSARGKRAAKISAAGRNGRRLWGSGKGNYTTTGSYGSATVRGTTWLVVDRCDSSTLIKVAEGVVAVRDFVKNKSLTLTAGQEYLARAPAHRPERNSQN